MTESNPITENYYAKPGWFTRNVLNCGSPQAARAQLLGLEDPPGAGSQDR
ncbi:MAG: hypothetical protein R2716_08900 [Microthrixaceae bacterium]